MVHDINLDVLREVLAGAESMVAYYSGGDEKARQNAALVAAGLQPIHSESSLEWDLRQAAEKRLQVECLRAVIALIEGLPQVAEAA